METLISCRRTLGKCFSESSGEEAASCVAFKHETRRSAETSWNILQEWKRKSCDSVCCDRPRLDANVSICTWREAGRWNQIRPFLKEHKRMCELVRLNVWRLELNQTSFSGWRTLFCIICILIFAAEKHSEQVSKQGRRRDPDGKRLL